MVIRQEYAEFLKAVFRSLKVEKEELPREIGDIQKWFEVIKENDREDEFWGFLQEEYGENPLELQELLKYLFQITGDRWFASWQMDLVLGEQFAKKSDYYLLLQLEIQRRIQYFQLNRKQDMQAEWKRNQYFQYGMQELLEMNYTKIPVKERNQDCIVIATTQLGGIMHAPTKLIMEFCYVIETYLNKRVLLLCTPERTDAKTLLGFDLRGLYEKRYQEELNGWFKMEYRGIFIEGYQILLEEGTRDEQKELMRGLYHLKPLCVWSFGGIPAFSGAMQQFTSFFYTLMNQEYPAVSADLIINYFKGASHHRADELKFLQEREVPVTDMIFAFPRPRPKGLMRREQFQIAENAFCIAIAGNRIEKECTDEFIRMLAEVMTCEPEIVLAVIGAVGEEFQQKLREGTKAAERCSFWGYQSELEEALLLIDLYVDLPHQGGGGVGGSAMSVGKPVLCLKGGDVSSTAGEDFSCDTIAGYAEEIIRYKNDTEYYKAQGAKAKEIAENMATGDAKLAELIWRTIEFGVRRER